MGAFRMRPKVQAVLAPAVVAVLVIAVWQLKVVHHLFDLKEFAVPLPFDVAEAMWTNRDTLLQRAKESLVPGVLGFALGEAIGLAIAGAIMALPGRTARQVTVMGAAVQSLPAIALVALVALWVDSATVLKITVVAIMVAPSMLIYMYRGFTSAKSEALELMSSYNASGLQVLRGLRLPSAVPHLFTQVKYATVIMLVAVILSEIMRTGDGFGFEIEHALGRFDTAEAWAAVFALALVGVLVYALASVVERVFFPWAARHKP
ncbi:ABC transporter permease [Nocardioides endophyticus]|uniref:ABC transporter permease n=1 Tax=Nocardioides endophyticus TaxID=1353775 RepID=A0ABP8YTF1_9ACTN